ncbi:MAG: hypothetical protein WC236_14695 [Gallionellaceae bacterium]|jgi:hypothetical protein
MKAINPIIQYAIDHGKDTTGLCTVRELAEEMLNSRRIAGECVCELAFTDEAGRRINMECAVTMVDGVPHARQWKPKFSITRLINRWRFKWIIKRKHGDLKKIAGKLVVASVFVFLFAMLALEKGILIAAATWGAAIIMAGIMVFGFWLMDDN